MKTDTENTVNWKLDGAHYYSPGDNTMRELKRVAPAMNYVFAGALWGACAGFLVGLTLNWSVRTILTLSQYVLNR